MIPARALFMVLLVVACSPEPKPAPPQVKAKPAEDPNALPVYSIAVSPGGLLLTDPKSRAAKPAPFGLRQSLVLGILSRTLGPAEEGRGKSCNRDFARWSNGLTLWFDAGDFSGWSLKDAYPNIGTAPGMVRQPTMSAGAHCD